MSGIMNWPGLDFLPETGLLSGSGLFGPPLRDRLQAQYERQEALEGLTREEREFVRAALRTEKKDFFLVLADYLEETGRDEASRRFRQMGA